MRNKIRELLARRRSAKFDPRDYWESRHRTDYGTFKAVGHRQLPDEQNAEQYEVKKERIVEMIRRYVDEPRGRTLLDAGCGTGHLTATYVELGFGVVGVDFSETALQCARRTGVDAWLFVSPLSRLDFESRFDVITVVDVLLHVVDEREWRDALAALARHLDPDGVMIVLDCFARPGEKWNGHCRPRSLDTYRTALEALHLTIDAHERFELAHEGATKDLIAVVPETNG